MTVSMLDRRLYEVPDAARLLRIPSSTLRYWLEGDGMRPPVLREERRGDASVSWGEFVEAGLLRSYRLKDVSLQHLRQVIVRLREEFGTPYPLATYTPFISSNHRLVLTAQEEAGLPAADGLVWEIVSGQTVLRDSVALYLDTVEFDDHQEAERVRPAGSDSPVVIDPRRSFGDGTISGVRTEIIREQVEAGEDLRQIAEDFSLTLDDVRAALSWEWRTAA